MTAADLHAAHLDHRVLGLELAVDLLKGVGDPFHGLHNIQRAQQLHIDLGGIADETQNGHVLAVGDMHIQALIFQPVDQMLHLRLGSTFFQNCDHHTEPLSKKNTAARRVYLVQPMKNNCQVRELGSLPLLAARMAITVKVIGKVCKSKGKILHERFSFNLVCKNYSTDLL